MWIRFYTKRPFAVKVYVGGINAVSGKDENHSLHDPIQVQDNAKQDYIVAGPQKWLDGFANHDGKVVQFVAHKRKWILSRDPAPKRRHDWRDSI